MKITICGDVCPTKNTEQLFIEGDIIGLFGDVLELFRQSDRAVVNLECALTGNDTPPIKKIGGCLRASKKCAKTLADAGITDCSLSNNHIFDYGIRGLRDTVKVLDEAGLLWTGVGENEDDSRRNHVMEIKDKKIAVVAVCEHEYTYSLPERAGARPYDPYDTMEDIRAAKNDADVVIVIYHGGKEQCEYPSPRLRKLCRTMVKNGADAVLCQHSHCIGCYEEYESGHILYGQGNFHFIKRLEEPQWTKGLVVQLEIGEKVDISFIPVVISGNGITLAKDDVKTEIMRAFNERNANLKNGEWLNKWRGFCLKLKDDYIRAFANAFLTEDDNFDNQLFLHFMDCEAQADVWRELFPTWNYTNEKI